MQQTPIWNGGIFIIGIYMIKNLVNQKVYIGQSKNLERRMMDHFKCLSKGTHYNTHLQRAWDKYGEENFEFSIIEICDEEDLDELERAYIAEYKSIDSDFGYNKDTGGGVGRHPSEESRRKMSEKKQGVYDGEKNPMYGVHLKCSEERKRYLSQKMSGKGNHMYGIHLKPTEEQRRRESERFSGEGNPFYGHKHTEEAKEKMKASKAKYRKPVRCIETGECFESSTFVARELGYDTSHILACCNGKQHTAYGYHWEFVA